MQFSQLLLDLRRAEVWVPWLERGIRVLLILAAAWLVTLVARRLLGRIRTRTVEAMERHGGVSDRELEKRAATIMTALTKLIATAVWMVAIVMALNELTFNVQPLLAGLGVAGLALGLGAQTLIKDWLGGLFLLIEDQVRIGDTVTLATLNGTVEEINLRTTVLRAENGAVHVIPNGSIGQITNFTREYSYYVLEATIAYGSDITRALAALGDAGQALSDDPLVSPLLLGRLEVMGLERFVERGMLIRARIKTLPAQQAHVGRELNLRIAQYFGAAKIALTGPPPSPPAPPPPGIQPAA